MKIVHVKCVRKDWHFDIDGLMDDSKRAKWAIGPFFGFVIDWCKQRMIGWNDDFKYILYLYCITL